MDFTGLGEVFPFADLDPVPWVEVGIFGVSEVDAGDFEHAFEFFVSFCEYFAGSAGDGEQGDAKDPWTCWAVEQSGDCGGDESCNVGVAPY